MHGIRQRDVDCLDLRIIDQFLITSIRPLKSILFFKRFGLGHITPGNSCQFTVIRELHASGCITLKNIGSSHNTPFNLSHRSPSIVYHL